jgi:Zn-dependent protease/CBS domain-containing protein
VIARRRNIEVEGIVLWVLGGVSKLKGEAADPGGELRIAVAGPAASLALAAGFFALSLLTGAGSPNSLLAAAFGWLGWINAALGVFNLVPALPLDGGRVLRSALWWHHGDKQRATNLAARSGQAFGFGFIGLGIVAFVTGIAGFGGLSGLWLAVIGWFLVSASRAEAGASTVAVELAGLRAEHAMTPDPFTVPAWVTVDRLMEEGVHRRRLSSFPVLDIDGYFAGLATLARIRRGTVVEHWGETRVGSIARPASDCVICGPEDDLVAVAGRIWASADRRAVVLVDRRAVGIISPSDLTRVAARPGPAPTAGAR